MKSLQPMPGYLVVRPRPLAAPPPPGGLPSGDLTRTPPRMSASSMRRYNANTGRGAILDPPFMSSAVAPIPIDAMFLEGSALLWADVVAVPMRPEADSGSGDEFDTPPLSAGDHIEGALNRYVDKVASVFNPSPLTMNVGVVFPVGALVLLEASALRMVPETEGLGLIQVGSIRAVSADDEQDA